ncbi:unnamed protein product [Brachionus calyciflorus]|uniref:Uncharacterized protein n=1 Tax=Brachionus calyciflorus TaxID=104777 RepID=A0A813N6R6_9BILA|nr:unnamed protein product [Brachionus calyciflorus]
MTSTQNISKRIFLGGTNQGMEIDESMFFGVKHNRGKDLKSERIWVFGLYERTFKAKGHLKKREELIENFCNHILMNLFIGDGTFEAILQAIAKNNNFFRLFSISNLNDLTNDLEAFNFEDLDDEFYDRVIQYEKLEEMEDGDLADFFTIKVNQLHK